MGVSHESDKVGFLVPESRLPWPGRQDTPEARRPGIPGEAQQAAGRRTMELPTGVETVPAASARNAPTVLHYNDSDFLLGHEISGEPEADCL